ncbi:probable receptor-like protein kinase At1g49730 [Impatiens glandulifera]|uniref:probable receptor-like protein kinase At1g49730 n=1 Tax=Impatiens glandulifera TaxID=253017 RepID=UPI001FB168BC|nr:probable receptor-like protein kinase At1g49730 [Impatiens glandulifera]
MMLDEVDKRKDIMVLATIYQVLPKDVLFIVAEKDFAKLACETLKKMHVGLERVKEKKVQTLKTYFEAIRMKNGELVGDFAIKLASIMTDEIRRALCKHNKNNPSLTQKQLQEWVHSNYGLQLLTDEKIIESVIGINKDDIDEEDDESSTIEPPSRNKAIKAAITLNNFLSEHFFLLAFISADLAVQNCEHYPRYRKCLSPASISYLNLTMEPPYIVNNLFSAVTYFNCFLFSFVNVSFSGRHPYLRCFSYDDIKKATNGFRRIMDSSSNGPAYKAAFLDGHVAMVKEAKTFNEDKDGFYREVQLLERLHHRHIISLCGFSTGRKRFLVFDHIENGSLKEHLNDPLKTPLNWRTRLQIAIGVAAALEYLYFFCDPPLYHVSISSSTIMLDENFNAKVSDIGLFSSGRDQTVLPHYSCPKECIEEVRKRLIFQLGLLILELITGQSSEKGSTDLIEWVQDSHFSNSIHLMIDPDLGNSYDSRELKDLLSVARLCIKSVDKPTKFIPQVLRYLQKKVSIPTIN